MSIRQVDFVLFSCQQGRQRLHSPNASRPSQFQFAEKDNGGGRGEEGVCVWCVCGCVVWSVVCRGCVEVVCVCNTYVYVCVWACMCHSTCSEVCLRFIVAVMEHSDQSYLGRKGFIWLVLPQSCLLLNEVRTGIKQSRNLEIGADSDRAMEGCCLLA